MASASPMTRVAVVLAVQQIEGNLLAPLLLSRAVQLHPVTILLSLAVGATVAGIWGALLSVPAAAAMRIALAEFVPGIQRVDHLEEELLAGHEPDSESDDAGEPGSAT